MVSLIAPDHHNNNGPQALQWSHREHQLPQHPKLKHYTQHRWATTACQPILFMENPRLQSDDVFRSRLISSVGISYLDGKALNTRTKIITNIFNLNCDAQTWAEHMRKILHIEHATTKILHRRVNQTTFHEAAITIQHVTGDCARNNPFDRDTAILATSPTLHLPAYKAATTIQHIANECARNNPFDCNMVIVATLSFVSSATKIHRLVFHYGFVTETNSMPTLLPAGLLQISLPGDRSADPNGSTRPALTYLARNPRSPSHQPPICKRGACNELSNLTGPPPSLAYLHLRIKKPCWLCSGNLTTATVPALLCLRTAHR